MNENECFASWFWQEMWQNINPGPKMNGRLYHLQHVQEDCYCSLDNRHDQTIQNIKLSVPTTFPHKLTPLAVSDDFWSG